VILLSPFRNIHSTPLKVTPWAGAPLLFYAVISFLYQPNAKHEGQGKYGKWKKNSYSNALSPRHTIRQMLLLLIEDVQYEIGVS
jgi:hypothetical protein